MIEHARHVPLRPIRWSESDATAAIEDIVADGLEHFDVERFWPAHPLDEGIRDGHTSFYFGATGVIWGIDYLGRVGATKARFDFSPILPRLMEANQTEVTRSHGSVLFGDLGTALLVMRVARLPRSPTWSMRLRTRGVPNSVHHGVALWPIATNLPRTATTTATPARGFARHCHGAPGMVTAFADAPFTSVELEDLLREGGKFTWAAGPLAKGSN